MWQDLHPKKYIDPFRLGRNGPRLDANTGLLPFHSDTDSTLWSSSGCRYPQKSCGYTYPELQRWLEKYKTNGTFDLQKYQKDLRTSIDSKYSTTARATLQLSGNETIASTVLSSLTTQNFMVQNVPHTLLAKAPLVKSELDSQNDELKREAPLEIAPSVSVSGSPVSNAPPPPAKVVQPTALAASEEKWEEHDYIVNVLYDR